MDNRGKKLSIAVIYGAAFTMDLGSVCHADGKPSFPILWISIENLIASDACVRYSNNNFVQLGIKILRDCNFFDVPFANRKIRHGQQLEKFYNEIPQ